MRTISASSAETGDAFEGIYPEFSITLPQAGDPVVVYCRETGKYYDGQVTEANRHAYSVLVGEKRSGRFRRARKRRKMPPLGSLKDRSNKRKGEETARCIMEILRGNGKKMSTAEDAPQAGHE